MTSVHQHSSTRDRGQHSKRVQPATRERGSAKHGKLKLLLINATSCRVGSRIDSVFWPVRNGGPDPRHPPPPEQKSLNSEATTGGPEPRTARDFFLWRSSRLFPATPILPQRVSLKPHRSEIRTPGGNGCNGRHHQCVLIVVLRPRTAERGREDECI
jgi:hypothetical protein